MMRQRAAFLAITIGSMFLASTASGQQPGAPQAEAQPPHAPGPDIDMIVETSEENLAGLETGARRLQAKLKTEFQNGPEWKAAAEAARQTAKEYQATRKAAVSKAQAKPEYAQAASEYRKAQQEYDALTNRPADAPKREGLAKQVLAARAAMSKLEAAELNADPKVQSTRQAMLKAQAGLAELKKRLETAHENHPEWVACQKQIDAARSTLAEARRVQEQQAYASQARAERETQDRLRDETLIRLQQELLRQQIILCMQQQELAAVQAQWAGAPQMNTLRRSPVTGPAFFAFADQCVGHQDDSRYRHGGSTTRSVRR